MNDTTRQMGGALGVAVIGSVLASSYRPGVTSRLADLQAPSDVVNAARDSIGGAVDAASSLGEPLRSNVIAAARTEFVHAFSGSVLLAAGVLLVASVVAFALLPARAHDARESDESALDGLASLTFAKAEGLVEADADVADRETAGATALVEGSVR
jgi:hypothetical protein